MHYLHIIEHHNISFRSQSLSLHRHCHRHHHVHNILLRVFTTIRHLRSSHHYRFIPCCLQEASRHKRYATVWRFSLARHSSEGAIYKRRHHHHYFYYYQRPFSNTMVFHISHRIIVIRQVMVLQISFNTYHHLRLPSSSSH